MSETLFFRRANIASSRSRDNARRRERERERGGEGRDVRLRGTSFFRVFPGTTDRCALVITSFRFRVYGRRRTHTTSRVRFGSAAFHSHIFHELSLFDMNSGSLFSQFRQLRQLGGRRYQIRRAKLESSR
jgi:hypothetical protein